MADLGVLLLAAGCGRRLDGRGPKALELVGEKTILERSVVGILPLGPPLELVVVAPEGYRDACQLLVEELAPAWLNYQVVVGGPTRQESARLGLEFLSQECRQVLVHDAARALAPTEVFCRVRDRLRAGSQAVVPVVPIADTIKRVSSEGRVLEHLDRESLRAVQTPQGFDRSGLGKAYLAAKKAGVEFTDESALAAWSMEEVEWVLGSEQSFKITHPEDVLRAEIMMGVLPGQIRVGYGSDVHAFETEASRPLALAGLIWPEHRALAGHSDGDVAVHALVDALLSAAGLGDIGQIFGLGEKSTRSQSGRYFLERTLRLLTENGVRIQNASVQVMGDSPKIGPRRREAEAAISAALEGAPVSLTATTTDGLGFWAEGRGLSATAVALVSLS